MLIFQNPANLKAV